MSIDAVNGSWGTKVSQVYQVASPTKASARAAVGQTGTNPEDSVTLSPAAEKMLEMTTFFGVESGQPVTPADMQAYARDQMETFDKGFRALLRSNDIDMSPPVTLGTEPGSGRVIVTSDHPQAEKIEALLAEDFSLCNAYKGATGALELMQHMQEHSRFAQAYAANPQAALGQYAYLFNSTWDASVTFSDDGYEVSYNRLFRS